MSAPTQPAAVILWHWCILSFLASSSEAAWFLFLIERMRLSLSPHPQLSVIAQRVRAEAYGNIELTFYDLLDQLHTGHDAPGVEESLEAEHWTYAAFYPPVILFDNIVQVGTSADLDGIFPTVIELVIHAHAARSAMCG